MEIPMELILIIVVLVLLFGGGGYWGRGRGYWWGNTMLPASPAPRLPRVRTGAWVWHGLRQSGAAGRRMPAAFDLMRAFEMRRPPRWQSGPQPGYSSSKVRHEFLGQFRRVVERADHGVLFEAPKQAFRVAVAVAIRSLTGQALFAREIAWTEDAVAIA
jgi:hypothetical protein